MFRRAGTRFALALGCLVFAACSGGGSHGVTVAPASLPSAAAATALVSFKIPAPTTSAAAARRATYVSPSSSSLNYSATNGSTTFSNVIATLSTYCTSSGASRACTVPIQAPVGSDTFTISLYSGGSLLSTSTTTTSVTISEGGANVVPSMVLDPVASTMTVSFNGVPIGQAGTTPVTLSVNDAASQPISGLGTYVTTAADTPATLSFSASTSTAGSFSSDGCVSQATTFSPWTTTSSLSFCSTSTITLGTLYTATLGAATVNFSTRRTNVSGSSISTGASSTATNLTVQSIRGSDTLANFGFGATGKAYIGNYTGASWAQCVGAQAPVDIAKGGTEVFASGQGTANVKVFTYNSGSNTCSLTATTAGTGADVIAFANDPSPTSSLVFGISSNFSPMAGPVAILHAIDTTTYGLTDASVNCGTATSLATTYPTSLAFGPANVLYVGCFNGGTVSTYTTSPSFVTTPTAIPVATTGTGVWVGANRDVAYAVETGGAHLVIHTLATTSPLMATANYTFSTGDTLVTALDQTNNLVGNPLVVGNDDRLYLAVSNSLLNRIVAYDPYSATLTDPAVPLAAVVSNSALQNIVLSLSPTGRLLVGGYDASSNTLAAFTWPN
jgi:hypothetical protein